MNNHHEFDPNTTDLGPQIGFINPGEIDVRAITTLGVNVKSESTSPIGFFGTGLKYAIACILRNGGTVGIYSGVKMFEFFVKPEKVRGKEFGFVYMAEAEAEAGAGGKSTSHSDSLDAPNLAPRTTVIPLGFTTELGKQWKPWMAFRELWSNCKDENGHANGVVFPQRALPTPGETQIWIGGDVMLAEATSEALGQWLLPEDPGVDPVIWRDPRGQVEIRRLHGEASKTLFYKNIRVAETEHPGLFTYNVLGNLGLTEDRTASPQAVISIIRKAICQCDNEALLEQLLDAGPGHSEAGWNFAYEFNTPSPAFLAVATRLVDLRLGTANKSALDYAARFMTDVEPATVALTQVEIKMLTKAQEFLARLGHRITEPVRVVESLGSQWISALAKNGVIYLPKSEFARGTKHLAGTLLEEHLHITHRLSDESRELQDWLLQKVISMGEELEGEPL